MLIKIPKIYTDETEEKTVDIWVNTDLIIKIEPYLNEKQPSIAKSIVAMRDVEPWNWFKSTLTPDEIAKLVYGEKYKELYLSCPACGNFSWVDGPGPNYVRCSVCGSVFNKADIKIKETEE